MLEEQVVEDAADAFALGQVHFEDVTIILLLIVTVALCLVLLCNQLFNVFRDLIRRGNNLSLGESVDLELVVVRRKADILLEGRLSLLAVEGSINLHNLADGQSQA